MLRDAWRSLPSVSLMTRRSYVQILLVNPTEASGPPFPESGVMSGRVGMRRRFVSGRYSILDMPSPIEYGQEAQSRLNLS